mmetsp:Transcript_2694/g.8706  ORF Transcript_2694/g.8706 Transcript_2694/m.8706 type:complete len:400 (-) Transcript_2694:61-1260(-)
MRRAPSSWPPQTRMLEGSGRAVVTGRSRVHLCSTLAGPIVEPCPAPGGSSSTITYSPGSGAQTRTGSRSPWTCAPRRATSAGALPSAWCSDLTAIDGAKHPPSRIRRRGQRSDASASSAGWKQMCTAWGRSGVLHAGARPLQHRRRHQGRHAEDADRQILLRARQSAGRHRTDPSERRAASPRQPHDKQRGAGQAHVQCVAQHGEGVPVLAASKVRGKQVGARHVEPEEEVDRRVGEHRRRAESSELLWSERTNNGSVDDRHDLGRESSGEDGQREAKQLQGGHIFRRTLIRRRNSAGRAVLVGAHSRQAGYWRVRQRLCFRVHCRHATGMPPDRVPATSMVSSACEKRPGLQRRQSEQGVDGDWQQQQHRDECRVVDTPSERVWRLRRGGARRASLAT